MGVYQFMWWADAVPRHRMTERVYIGAQARLVCGMYSHVVSRTSDGRRTRTGSILNVLPATEGSKTPCCVRAPERAHTVE